MRFFVTLKIDGFECVEEIPSHDHNTLYIGPEFAELIDADRECVDPPFWDALVRSNCFQYQANRIRSITLFGLQLDDWDVLRRELLKFGARLKTLTIEECDFTERGAHTLGRFLEESSSFGQPAFRIEQLLLYELEGSNSWTEGLLKNNSLRTIEFARLCSYEVIRFIQHTQKQSRHKKRITWKEIGEEDRQNRHGLEMFSLLRTQNNDNGTDKNKDKKTMACHSESMITLELDFSEGTTPDMPVLRALGGLLRTTPVENLLVGTLPNLEEYDFLADAVLSQVIYLQSNYVPRGLASLIRKDGCLREICITDVGLPNEEKLEALLSFTDLTHLGRLQTDRLSISQEFGKAFLDLCHHISHNKGPRQIAFSLEGEPDDESDEDEIGELIMGNAGSIIAGMSVGETERMTKNAAALETFTTALGDNDKVQHLEIEFRFFITTKTLEHFIRLMSTLPALLSLDISSCSYIIGSENEVERCKELALSLATMSKSVRFSLPRTITDEKLVQRIREIPYRRVLRCCGNDVSDGIWSYALNHAAKNDPSVMFGVVRELPGLIQQCNAVKMIEPPQFSVPHHPNCPACCKRQKNTK